jgi:hypothetical protein
MRNEGAAAAAMKRAGSGAEDNRKVVLFLMCLHPPCSPPSAFDDGSSCEMM